MSDRNDSLGMAVASLCIELIYSNPELITRLQEHARKREAPFDAGKLDEQVLLLADRLVTAHGYRASRRAQGQDTEKHLVVPVPTDAELAEQSAGALAIGGYMAEYMYENPEALAGFGAWWDEHHDPKGAVTAERMEATDEMLTFMAAAVLSVAEGRTGVDGEHRMHRHTEDVDLNESDDGIRYV